MAPVVPPANPAGRAMGRITRSVDVDVASGRVTVTSAAPLSDDAVRAAVTEAGYELVAS